MRYKYIIFSTLLIVINITVFGINYFKDGLFIEYVNNCNYALGTKKPVSGDAQLYYVQGQLYDPDITREYYLPARKKNSGSFHDDLSPGFYQIAAELGNADAMIAYAGKLLAKTGNSSDIKAALNWLKEAVRNGNPRGYAGLAMLYYSGASGIIEKDQRTGLQCLKRGAEMNDNYSQLVLGRLMTRASSLNIGFGDIDLSIRHNHNHYAEGEKWLLQAAGSGQTTAYCHLALHYKILLHDQKDNKKKEPLITQKAKSFSQLCTQKERSQKYMPSFL